MDSRYCPVRARGRRRGISLKDLLNKILINDKPEDLTISSLVVLQCSTSQAQQQN